MRRLNITLALSLFIAISLRCASASSTSPTDNNFIEIQKKGFRPALNKMGDQFPQIPMQEEIYKFVMALDQNHAIKNPVFADFGGAYGLMIAELLKRTKRVTFIYNDLCEDHFNDFKKWAEANKFTHRVIYAPGNFLLIEQSETVRKFFNYGPVKLNGILVSSVFPHLNPME